MKLPPLDLLKSIHTFPGRYTFKVVGKNDELFLSTALSKVKGVAAHPDKVHHTTRESSGGKHLAVTLEVTVVNAEEVHSIYAVLVALDGVVLVL